MKKQCKSLITTSVMVIMAVSGISFLEYLTAGLALIFAICYTILIPVLGVINSDGYMKKKHDSLLPMIEEMKNYSFVGICIGFALGLFFFYSVFNNGFTMIGVYGGLTYVVFVAMSLTTSKRLKDLSI